jgi:hypothetical protein
MGTITHDLSETLRTLTALQRTELPFLSAYIDLTPELDAGTHAVSGADRDDAPLKSWRRSEAPAHGHVRPGIRQMHDLLREQSAHLPERGPERESFDADAERIRTFLEGGGDGPHFDPSTRSVALFACSGEGIWQVVELAVPLETRLTVDRTPLVYPLARAEDRFERFALCIADSTSARVYVVALGTTEQEETVDGAVINRTMVGGLSQQRIQERIANAVSSHMRDVARRLEEIVFRDDIGRIVLGGDEIARTEFHSHLSPRAWERVVTVDRLDIRLPADQAIAQALEAVLAAEQTDALALAEEILGETLSHGRGAAGAEAVSHALRLGAVDTLLIDPALDAPGWRCVDDPTQVGAGGTPANCPTGPGIAEAADLREELTAVALQTGARIEFVEGSPALARMGGVATLLRWRPEDLPLSPVADEERKETHG